MVGRDLFCHERTLGLEDQYFVERKRGPAEVDHCDVGPLLVLFAVVNLTQDIKRSMLRAILKVSFKNPDPEVGYSTLVRPRWSIGFGLQRPRLLRERGKWWMK